MFTLWTRKVTKLRVVGWSPDGVWEIHPQTIRQCGENMFAYFEKGRVGLSLTHIGKGGTTGIGSLFCLKHIRSVLFLSPSLFFSRVPVDLTPGPRMGTDSLSHPLSTDPSSQASPSPSCFAHGWVHWTGNGGESESESNGGEMVCVRGLNVLLWQITRHRAQGLW